MLPSLDDCLHTKNLRYQLVLSGFIADKRILQFDWMRDTTGHTQSKSDSLKRIVGNGATWGNLNLGQKLKKKIF